MTTQLTGLDSTHAMEVAVAAIANSNAGCRSCCACCFAFWATVFTTASVFSCDAVAWPVDAMALTLQCPAAVLLCTREHTWSTPAMLCVELLYALPVFRVNADDVEVVLFIQTDLGDGGNRFTFSYSSPNFLGDFCQHFLLKFFVRAHSEG